MMENQHSITLIRDLYTVVHRVFVDLGLTPESAAEDIVFNLAAYLDEGQLGSEGHSLNVTITDKSGRELVTNDSLHELVYPALDGFEVIPHFDYLVGECEVTTASGITYEFNILNSQLNSEQTFMESLEFELELRDMDEIEAKIDTRKRWRDKFEKADRIVLIRYCPAIGPRASQWEALAFPENKFGTFTKNLKGLGKLIRHISEISR